MQADLPLTDILECLPDAATFLDSAGHIVSVNEAFLHLTGLPAQMVIAQPISGFLHAPGGGLDLEPIRSELAAPGARPLSGEIVVGRRGRRGRRCRFRIGRVERQGHGHYLVTLQRHDRGRPRGGGAALVPDGVTGLMTRDPFADAVERAVLDARREGSRLALLFIDLDHFKEVNDNFGHERGDRVLAIIASRFARAVRGHDLLARWGGDEFVCLLAIDADDRAIVDVAERLLAEVAVPIELPEATVAVGASIGIARAPDDAQSGTALLSAADHALYEAKSQGGFGWRTFAPAMAARSRDRTRLRDDLGRAIRGDELQLYYQPMIDAATFVPVGVEALLRWLHPSRGIVGPGAFLPLAATSQERALQLLDIQIRRALADGPDLVAIGRQVAINFDARLVGNDEAFAMLGPLQRGLQLLGLQLTVELTEAAFTETPHRLQDFATKVRSLGIDLAIDDFGVGQASLLRLREISFDVLKVDRAFLGNVAGSERDRAISALAAKIGTELAATSVAEGVETSAQAAWACRLGYHVLQGFRMARPMPATALAAWHQHWKASERKALRAEMALEPTR
ncbi:MAG: EAL domain-containing protein [Pseudomonadota bacterium]